MGNTHRGDSRRGLRFVEIQIRLPSGLHAFVSPPRVQAVLFGDDGHGHETGKAGNSGNEGRSIISAA